MHGYHGMQGDIIYHGHHVGHSLGELAEDAFDLAVNTLQDLQFLLNPVTTGLHFGQGLLPGLLPHGLLVVGEDLSLDLTGITDFLDPSLQFLVSFVQLAKCLALSLHLRPCLDCHFLQTGRFLTELLLLLVPLTLVEGPLPFQFLRDDRAVLPEGSLEGLLIAFTPEGDFGELEGDFLLLEGDDSVGEAICQVVPHPLRLQVHGDDVPLPCEVTEGVTVLVSSATDTTADHADPVVLARSTENTDGRLFGIKCEAGWAGQGGGTLAELHEDGGSDAGEVVLQTFQAVETAREFHPSLLLHEGVEVEGRLEVRIGESEAMSAAVLSGREQGECGLSEVEGEDVEVTKGQLIDLFTGQD